MARKYIDFEVMKESWNTYSLRDGTKLKIRIILTAVWKDTTGDSTTHRVTLERQLVCLCDPTLQGEPNTRPPTPEELKESVEVSSCKYKTTQYETGEYLLDDGFRVAVHCNMSNIARTSLFDHQGNRLYLLDATGNASLTPPQN